MGVFETMTRVVQLGGAAERAPLVAQMRAQFEARTGAFAPEDGWFEERSRAFWCDAVTTGRFGREVEGELTRDDLAWLGPLERAHRGLFRATGAVLVDAWSGAELVVGLVDDAARAELDAASGQLFDARVAGHDEPLVVALLPGAIFHPREATPMIESVVAEAHARGLSTIDTLDALLRMERTLRSLTRVKASYAYRPDALAAAPAVAPLRRAARGGS
jgi:hypothetical protein